MKYQELTKTIIGIAMKIHKEIGFGFPEKIYQRALVLELQNHNIYFEKEKELTIFYKNKTIGKRRLDFLIKNILIIELKATPFISPKHLKQCFNYLYAFKKPILLLLNFGSKSLVFKRLHNNRDYKLN